VAQGVRAELGKGALRQARRQIVTAAATRVHPGSRRGPGSRSRYLALASIAIAAPLWVACRSGGGGQAAAAPLALCQKLFGDFANGPDSDADPVGYALSQIKPLSEIHTSDDAVSAPLTKLISADRALVDSDGSDHAAKTAIAKADKVLNTACPGVAS
jgi:hypothetical protein